MPSNSVVKFDDTKYKSSEYHRAKSPSSKYDSPVIQYIRPRVIVSNPSDTFQGPFRGIAWAKVGSNRPPTTTTDLGLATLIQPSRFATIPSLHSIDGERIIDEYRELSKLTEILCTTILKCCHLDTHNRAQELQIEWLEKQGYENSSIIEKLFRNQIENAKKLQYQTSQTKPALETKFNSALKETSTNDKQYQQILSKRDQISKVIFDYERQIAQNSAECQFIQRRIRNLDDESKFYLLKNQALDARKIRLRYELDEERFARQALQTELKILEDEKITKQDIQITALDDIRKSIDIYQIAGFQPPNYYSDQLKQELQRIRDDYEKKIEVRREELHRNFELEFYRYKMDITRSTPKVSKEHEATLEEYQNARKDVYIQINIVRGNINELSSKINNIEQRMNSDKTGQHGLSERERYLTKLNQSIQERERQLNEILRIRKALKQQIENYRERLDRYSKHSHKRITFHEGDLSFSSINSPRQTSSYRSSLQDISRYPNDPIPFRPIRSISPARYLERPAIKRSDTDANLTRNSSVEHDCRILHRLVNDSPIDELGIIRIICNRTLAQRLLIRDRYKDMFNQNLGDAIEKITNGSLSKLLRILLLSMVEHDCFELRRTCKRGTIDVNIFIDILFNRSNKHIQNVRNTYLKLFKSTIEEDIRSDRNDHSKQLFMTILQSNRSEDSNVNDQEIIRDARELFETESKWRLDGSTIVRLLCTRSNTQLKHIFTAYQQYSHVDIEETIEKNIEGKLYHTLISIIRIIRDRSKYFAYELEKCLQDVITKEDDLNRIIVSRCEVDIGQIKNEYENITKHKLHDRILLQVIGSYKRALLALLHRHFELDTQEIPGGYTNKARETLENTIFNRSTVQWREPVSRIYSDTYTKRPLQRSTSDRTIDQRRYGYRNDYVINSSDNESLLTVNARPLRNDRRNFVRMSTLNEDHSHK
ncbi:hypothetical protein I4U23_028373 [Adineta vaga]|nr:hypothetical protein I4U23_028373 [Adineta vaga]